MTQLPPFTEDTVLNGQVHLVQPEKGFRAGTDSLLLAAALPDLKQGTAFEAGTGCGGALLPAAWRLPEMTFQGVEIDPIMATMARIGAKRNEVAHRVTIDQGHLKHWVRDKENRFDLTFSNPPYFAPGTIPAPGAGKESAYIASLSVLDWVKAMLFTLKPRAPIVIVHRAACLAELLDALHSRSGEITILPIVPKSGRPANRVLIRARKGLRKGDTRLLSPLILRKEGDGDRPTPALQHIRGGGGIDW